MFSTRTEVRAINLDPQSTTPPFTPVGNLTNVVGVDFDYKNQRLLFTQIRPWARIASMSASEPSSKNIVDIRNKG